MWRLTRRGPADAVRRLKPAPEPYRMATERLGVTVGEVRLIAAHAWDVAGAVRAGCAAAFVTQPARWREGTVELPSQLVSSRPWRRPPAPPPRPESAARCGPLAWAASVSVAGLVADAAGVQQGDAATAEPDEPLDGELAEDLGGGLA
jgi:hypothetical protein